ncbi:zinc finger FYVE domain-containing protein 26 [Bombina bombina]|uniref:zinc finger FYVE domain-containing protein 26 n=1 Tax=Bombina bombina TaxID=8345 RepID=UPI00235A8A63|nr:zinc finger FYVE domain-containing protein 26 [Bombina bombina]
MLPAAAGVMSHPFGEEEAASLRSLYRFFCRCLRRGHWELARVCLPQLHRGPQAVEVEETLRALVAAPHLLRDEKHTAQQISWFWLNALEKWLDWDQKPLQTFLKDETEFLLLLEELQDDASEASLKEMYEAFLYSHHENRRDGSAPQLSPSTVSCLQCVLSQNPRLVQALIGFLLADSSLSSALEYNHHLLNIYIDFLLVLLTSLQETQQNQESNEHLAGQIYNVLSTMHFNSELQSTELKHFCNELFQACWSEKSVLKEEQVQTCMLRRQNYTLVSMYGSVASEKLKAEITAQRTPEKVTGVVCDFSESERAILRLFCDPEQINPWKTAYFYCLYTGKHFLEQILLTSLTLLKREDFSTLNNLLKREFKPLRRLLVLLGWTHCQSIESAKSLLGSLHQNMDLCNDFIFKDFCDGLQFQVEALEWCIEHNSREISKEDILRHLYSLDSHSALYILYHLTNLPDLIEEDVLKLLQRVTPREKTEHDSLNNLDAHVLAQQRNTILYQAFCSMKYGIYALCINSHKYIQCKDCMQNLLSGSQEDKDFSKMQEKEQIPYQDYTHFFVQYFTKCQYYVHLLPASLRLEVLENLFSLMFVSLSDLNKETTQPEDYATEENEEDVYMKRDNVESLDSSLDKGESLVISSPVESPQYKDNSIFSTDLTGISHGSTSSTPESTQKNSCAPPRLNYLDLKHFTKGSTGFLVDEVVLDTFLKMLKEELEDLKNPVPWTEVELKLLEYMNIPINRETFNSRVLQLYKYVSETLWRYKIVMRNRNAEELLASVRLPSRTLRSSSFRRRSRKNKRGFKKQMENTSSELSTSESSASNLSMRSELDYKIPSAHQNYLIPMLISSPESMLISCILRGNYVEAHQVALMFNLQSTPSYGELIFMERYQEVVQELNRVEQKIENQNSDTRVRKLSNSRSTLKAIGNAAAAGMVFYSISDVTDRLLAPAEGPISTLQDDFWMKSVHLEKNDPWRQVVEELLPSAIVAFDLACTQAHLWKTCKQLLETAERRLLTGLESWGRKPESVLDHPGGINGFPAMLQQMTKIINYPSPSQEVSELEEKISSQFKCNISDILHTCYPVLTDDCIVCDITLDYKLEQILTKLKAAIKSHEPKGNIIQSLMDQLSVKPQDVQVHPVRHQMSLLLENLEERDKSVEDFSLKPYNLSTFFNYIDTLAKVVLQSINTELDQTVDLKLGNPFILLQQRPSQLISHLLFERQIPPERLSLLLEKESIGLNVENVITDYCCEPMSFCSTRKKSQTQSLFICIQQSAKKCVELCLPDAVIQIASSYDTEELVTNSPISPTPDSNQYALTASALNFLKSKSNLTALIACLSASKPVKLKSGISWMELRGSKKESPLEMENIVKECDSLLSEFPVLQRFLSTMAVPFRDGQAEGIRFVSYVCGKPCATLVLLGLHAPTAMRVIASFFQEAVTKKDWTSAFQMLDLYADSIGDLTEVRDALLCCAAVEEKDGWKYLLGVKDPTLRCKQALQFLEKWPLNCCREILSYCVCEPGISDDLKLELLNQRKEMEVYQKILDLKEEFMWASWQDLKKACIDDPQSIINIILEAKDYSLCEDWGHFYQIPMEHLIILHREHLLHQLEKEDTEKTLQLLQRIEDPDLRFAISEQALLQEPGIVACHFLSEYLLTQFQNNMSDIRCQEIRDVYMGSKVLLALPEEAHPNCKHLISCPLLLLEQLLMNMKIDWASVTVQTLQQILVEPESSFSTEDVDKLLCIYAGKALDVPFSFREGRSDSTSRIPENHGQSAEPETILSSSPTEPSLADRTWFQTPTTPQDKGLRRMKSSPEFVPPDKPPAKTQWIPDETEITCMVCKNERFTMFNRRHHCRRCGRLVCSSCSMKKMVVEGCRENPARVCDQCHNYFSTNNDKTDEDVEYTEEANGGSPNLSDVLKLSKAGELQWRLSLNESENEVERSEFYYEQAPSASLCSAILYLHSKSYECGYQLIERCCMLSMGLTNPEMDSRLLLDIMKNLLFTAKMMFVKAGRSQDLALCDSYSSKVDLLKILVAASYQHIPSLDEIIRPAAVTRLRNRLLEAEYYNLAIEVSTKTGLDPAGVWHAWGMACLKSHNLPGAREKFSRCLKAPLDLNQKNIGSKLLEDVVKHLESAAKPILLVKDDDYFATLKELEMTFKARCFYYEMMPEGKIQNNAYYQECLYYLHTYGTHLGIIQFYMRHDLMREALLHLLNKDCPGDIFIEGVFVPSYEGGKLHMLENLLESIDPSLESWSLYLIEACKHLQQRNFYNILYELQQFMKDHVRAAMTCIRFFSHKAKSYRDLGDNQNWLIKSKDHLRICLQEISRSSSRRKSFDTFRKKMSAADISRHINTVELQLEVTRFLQRCEASGTTQISDEPPPTLFGHSSKMIDVACRVILGGKNVIEGFGIAFRVIQDFQLDATKVYSKVCKQLVQREHYSEILQLVKCVSESGIAADKDCDEILLKCVGEMSDMSPDELEKLIQGVRSDENKIKAFLKCRMMRSAYLTAVKQEHTRAIQLVQEVWQVAHSLNDTVVQGICTKWLLEHPQTSKEVHRQSSRK